MADLHIDDFYRDCAMILLRLHATFPRKTILYVDEVCGPDSPDEFGLHSERHQACLSAMIWLGEAGYLSFTETIRAEALDQAVLSQHGFLLLNSRSELELGFAEELDADGLPPSVMERSMSNVMQIRRALREGSSIIVQQVMHHLLSAKR